MVARNPQVIASAEMLAGVASFILGAVAFMIVESWVGTALFVAGSIAAVAFLWVARWQVEPGERGWRWSEMPGQGEDAKQTVSMEVLLAATAFLLGAVAYITLTGWLATGLFILGGVVAVMVLLFALYQAEPPEQGA